MRTPQTVPPVAAYSAEKFDRWFERNGREPFSPEWNKTLIQRMLDPDESPASRTLAWTVLYAAGNFSDHPIDSNGKEKYQGDCGKEIGLDKRRVSEGFAFNASRGYLEILVTPRGRILFKAKGNASGNGRINGEAQSEPFGQDSPFVRYPEFRQKWLEAHPDKRAAWVEAKAVIDVIDLAILSDWKQQKEEVAAPESVNGSQRNQQSERLGQVVRKGTDDSSEKGTENGRPIIRTVKPIDGSSKQVSKDRAYLPTDPPRLAALRGIFQKELIADRVLTRLDNELEQEFPALYFPERFIAAVRARKDTGRVISFGLLLKREPGSFIADFFEHERRTAVDRAAAAQRKKNQQAEADAESIREADRTLDHPDATEEEKELARMVKNGGRTSAAGG